MYFTPDDAVHHELEFDEHKSKLNKEKHGIDFVEAQRLWDDERRVEIPARFDDEDRSLIVGRIGDQHWTAVVTHRGDKTRIISVRRSRTKEIESYES